MYDIDRRYTSQRQRTNLLSTMSSPDYSNSIFYLSAIINAGLLRDLTLGVKIYIHVEMRLQFQSFFKGSEVSRSEFSRSEVSRSEFSRSEVSRSEFSRSEV